MKKELHTPRAEDFRRARELCACYTGESCELSFANLALYAEPQDTRVAPFGAGLLVHFATEGLLLPPLGTEELPPRELAALARELDAEVYDAAPGYSERFPDCADFFTASAPEGEADYLYDCADLVENAGAKLRKKRNLIRQFDTLYPEARILSVSADNIARVVAFAEQLNSQLVQAPFLAEENAAMERAAQCFDAVALHGVLLEVGGRPAGFSLFSRIGGGRVWDVHFEKADHAFKGAPQKLTQAAAAAILSLGGVFMNREQDMDEPGLRHAKQSLAPAHLYRRERLKPLPSGKLQ